MRENVYNDDERQYLQMMQSNIERMAANSANCKAWMVTIVAALMALQCTSIGDLNGWLLLGLLPILLFWYLDTFYLHLERGMRNRERDFLNKRNIEDASVYETVLFNLKPLMIDEKDLTDEQKQAGIVATDDRWFSKSTAPFYLTPIIVIVVMTIVINWSIIIGWFCNRT